MLTVEPGQRFGLLVVLSEARIQKPYGSKRVVICDCDCGELTVVHIQRLLSGSTRSCGCIRRRTTTERSLRHGLSQHPLYRTWHAMLYRCHNPKSPSYQWYGAQGVQVCDQWHDLAAFVEWIEANLGSRPLRHTLDRIDSAGNYEPGNVRWADAATQTRNRRVSA